MYVGHVWLLVKMNFCPRKKRVKKILSAGLVALLGVRIISVFLHFSSVTHVVNHESGHRQGIHGCNKENDDQYGRIIGESLRVNSLGPHAVFDTVAWIESRDGHGSFNTHYCHFEDCLTEQYENKSRYFIFGVVDSLDLEVVSDSGRMFASSKIFLFTAPKNSPPV